MEIYYQNSENRKVYLDRYPYYLTSKTDLFDYEWETAENNYNKKTVMRASRKISNKTITIGVCGKNGQDCLTNYKNLVDILDIDALSRNPGMLYVGEGYLKCWILASKNSNEYLGNRITTYAFTVVPEVADWIYESITIFRKIGSDAEVSYLDYPYDFKYDYRNSLDGQRLNNDGFSDSEFEMIIYGPCTNPEIFIADHKYAVNCVLADGEYLIINSVTRKIYKVANDGGIINQFHLRDKESYIFYPVPAGNYDVTWEGSYGFDITLFEKRSEPRWT